MPKEEIEEDWLRRNIFHTTCTIGGKVCKLIIDGGSCENVVSTDVVKKLQLKQVKHPKPYKLSWFKKGNEVIVVTRCLILFSIVNKYVDEVWCDVVKMDACHVLLERPRGSMIEVLFTTVKRIRILFWKDKDSFSTNEG